MLKLKEIRKQKGISQAELARRVGCSQVSICNFESGRMNPSLETLVKLSKALDCSLEDLVSAEPEPA